MAVFINWEKELVACVKFDMIWLFLWPFCKQQAQAPSFRLSQPNLNFSKIRFRLWNRFQNDKLSNLIQTSEGTQRRISVGNRFHKIPQALFERCEENKFRNQQVVFQIVKKRAVDVRQMCVASTQCYSVCFMQALSASSMKILSMFVTLFSLDSGEGLVPKSANEVQTRQGGGGRAARAGRHRGGRRARLRPRRQLSPARLSPARPPSTCTAAPPLVFTHARTHRVVCLSSMVCWFKVPRTTSQTLESERPSEGTDLVNWAQTGDVVFKRHVQLAKQLHACTTRNILQGRTSNALLSQHFLRNQMTRSTRTCSTVTSFVRVCRWPHRVGCVKIESLSEFVGECFLCRQVRNYFAVMHA